MAWTKAHDDLFKKINQEMDNYARGMWDLPGYAVYGKANEIAAMGFCYNQLAEKLHDCSAEELGPLLEQEKPLEFLARHWTSEQAAGLGAEFDQLFRSANRQEESERQKPGPSMA